MRHFIAMLAVPLFLMGGLLTAQGSELTGIDPNPSARPAVPVEKYIRPPQDQMRVSLEVLVDGKPGE